MMRAGLPLNAAFPEGSQKGGRRRLWALGSATNIGKIAVKSPRGTDAASSKVKLLGIYLLVNERERQSRIWELQASAWDPHLSCQCFGNNAVFLESGLGLVVPALEQAYRRRRSGLVIQSENARYEHSISLHKASGFRADILDDACSVETKKERVSKVVP